MDHPQKMTKPDRRHAWLMIDAMRKVEQDLHHRLFEMRSLPRGWDEIHRRLPEGTSRRSKVTALFDADVVAFFKGLGPGYQNRMNLVLRAYMHGRLAKIIEGPDSTDWILRPETIPDTPEMAEWGDTERQVAEVVKGRE